MRAHQAGRCGTETYSASRRSSAEATCSCTCTCTNTFIFTSISTGASPKSSSSGSNHGTFSGAVHAAPHAVQQQPQAEQLAMLNRVQAVMGIPPEQRLSWADAARLNPAMLNQVQLLLSQQLKHQCTEATMVDQQQQVCLVRRRRQRRRLWLVAM